MTDRAPAKQAPRFLRPPLTIAITFGQRDRDWSDVDVMLASGKHVFMHRAIRTRYDTFGDIDPIVSSGLLKWVLWAIEFERQRRNSRNGEPVAQLTSPPAWPAPVDAAPNCKTGHDEPTLFGSH
jgi:hypothetical protein